MVRQERELALKRAADERLRVAAEIGRDLGARLDDIARQEASALAETPARLGRHDYVRPEVVLVAEVDGARLVMPWEAGLRSAASLPPG
jgi:hypothetical protein